LRRSTIIKENHGQVVAGVRRAPSRVGVRRLEGYVPAMKNKGRTAVGADADITVFDIATIIDQATFREPMKPALGLSHVLVNGTFVVRNGELIPDAGPGRAIRAK
jgi:N-acyl-D-aspartate/D-glutamate deacylase